MKRFMTTAFVAVLALLIMGFVASSANATVLDLTTIGSSGTLNGGIFSSPSVITSGTGLIDSFLRIQASGKKAEESGYNTDGALEFDTKSGAFTHSLLLSAIQTNIVNVGGTDYYEFVLDVNETTPDSLITLLDLEFYIDPSPSKTGYPALGTKVYDLDIGADGDSEVRLDANNFSGSGQLDMLALIPTSLFGSDLTQNIYLYSKFGQPDGVDDGFEEWAHKETGTFTPRDNVIPEPSTLLLLGTGLLGLVAISRKKRKKSLSKLL
jgi:hypothetical protein